MSASDLDDMWRRLQTLPVEKQQEVRDFVEFLIVRQRPTQEPPEPRRDSFTDGPYFGMWSDRDDMKDSVRWVRELREHEWNS